MNRLNIDTLAKSIENAVFGAVSSALQPVLQSLGGAVPAPTDKSNDVDFAATPKRRYTTICYNYV